MLCLLHIGSTQPNIAHYHHLHPPPPLAHFVPPSHYFLHQCQQQSSPQSYPPSRPNTFPPKTSNSPRLQDDKRPIPGARCDWRRDGRQRSKAAIPVEPSGALGVHQQRSSQPRRNVNAWGSRPPRSDRPLQRATRWATRWRSSDARACDALRAGRCVRWLAGR